MEAQFPYGMRPARVAERRQFYENEFSLATSADWFRIGDQEQLVIDVGSETTRYRPMHKQYLYKLLYVTQYLTHAELNEKILTYVPEDIYYDTKSTPSSAVQELVFDLDPNHLYCMHCRMMRNKLSGPISAYAFCEQCFIDVATATAELNDLLSKHFTHLSLIYSGRGFHIHVRDNAAWQLPYEQRQALAEKMQQRFPIDMAITAGSADLIRLPDSLNGLVSRKVREIHSSDLEQPEKIINEKALPAFLHDQRR